MMMGDEVNDGDDDCNGDVVAPPLFLLSLLLPRAVFSYTKKYCTCPIVV